MAKILVKTYDISGEYDSEFRDVKPSYWAYSDINSLAANNITIGLPDNRYNPVEAVTRNHFVLFMARTKEESFRPVFKEIIFNDPVLETTIREQLSKPKGQITSYNMGAITSIDLADPSIHFTNRIVYDFSSLEYALNLKSLSITLPYEGDPVSLEST